MEKTKMAVNDICCLKDRLIESAREAMSRGIQNVNTHEMGEVTDMIKDLAEAEEKCWKGCYYKMLVCGEMMDDREENEMDRMGYDNWRYSSGRYAPKGRGHRSGYRPTEGMEPWMNEDYKGADSRMGYSGSDRGSRFDKWSKARMGYHQAKDASSKEHMDSTARDYVIDMAEAVKEVWREADPAMRKEIKNKFVALTSEMN